MKKNLKSPKNQPGKRKVNPNKGTGIGEEALRGQSEKEAAIRSRKDSEAHYNEHQRPR